MSNINENRYPNIAEAVAFRIAFAPVICSYGNVGWDEIEEVACSRCGKMRQIGDFLAPKNACQKDFAILDTYHYGFSVEIHDLLIENFDITEEDFRPVRNKVGDIVFYQIAPRHILPPIESVNRYRKLKPCSKCGSVQYRSKPYETKEGWQYHYITKEALDDMHDLNESFERFNMHLPYWIVSRHVYDFLIKRYPRMFFQPMFLKEI